MGMHADDTVYATIDMEALRDEYVNGDISSEDAFDLGFLDASGMEQEGMEAAWDRSLIGTPSDLSHELRHALADLEVTNRAPVVLRGLNLEAKRNLLRPRPTCNICGRMMDSREGKYGKFYYCNCKDQGTVSDKYWQSVRIRA